MAQTHFYQPSQGHGLPHDPFKAIIAPRPIGWISTVDANGRTNLAPYSFFNAVCDAPPILCFSSSGRKDSQKNIEATGEFVFNLATVALAQQMNASSAPFPPGVSEFELAGLEPAASTLVGPPRVATSPAAMECRVLQVLPLLDLDGRPTPNTLIIGQVVGVHINAAYLTAEGLFDTARARPLARCGYAADYAEVDHLLKMRRP